jgi:hypothetical protein
MTDLQELTALLDRWGVAYKDRPKSEREIPVGDVDPTPWMRSLSIGTDGEKNIGYGGFVCEFYFDDEEEFVKVGVWE